MSGWAGPQGWPILHSTHATPARRPRFFRKKEAPRGGVYVYAFSVPRLTTCRTVPDREEEGQRAFPSGVSPFNVRSPTCLSSEANSSGCPNTFIASTTSTPGKSRRSPRDLAIDRRPHLQRLNCRARASDSIKACTMRQASVAHDTPPMAFLKKAADRKAAGRSKSLTRCALGSGRTKRH